MGELRGAEPNSQFATELHVNYGMRDGLYIDWSVSLNKRLGSIDDFRVSKKTLPRRKLQRIDVSQSAIRHHVYDPNYPHRSPEVRTLERLRAGQETFVDESYVEALKLLHAMWRRTHGQHAMDDAHTKTTFAFAAKDREPSFRDGDFSFVRNTLIALESDESEEILVERGGQYFPKGHTTLGAFFQDGRMRFINAGESRDTAEGAEQRDPDALAVTGRTSIGMLIDTYWGRGSSGSKNNKYGVALFTQEFRR